MTNSLLKNNGNVLNFSEGEVIALYLACYIKDDGKLYIASKNDVAKCGVAGIKSSTNTIQTSGTITNSAWTLTIGAICYLGDNGNIIQDLDLVSSIYGEATVMIGKAQSINSIYIDIGTPVINGEVELDYVIPTGTIVEYGGSSSPPYWLICDGTIVSRTTYSKLFSVIGVVYGVGDGSTTFNIPDMREAVPVGIGQRASGVVAHDEYTLGQFKDDQMHDHIHGVVNSLVRYAGSTFDLTSGAGNDASTIANPITGPIANGANGTPRLGTTTHGKQLGLNFIIKT